MPERPSPGVDVGRIVPSTRDLLLAIGTQRKSLALIPCLDPEASIPEQSARLAALDVRAFAIDDAGEPMQRLARSTQATPTLSLVPARSAEDGQRARFFGADGVLVAGGAEGFAALARSVQSMRMVPVGLARSETETAALAEAGAKAVLLDATTEIIVAAAPALTRGVLIARAPTLDGPTLAALAGVVDAVLVPSALTAGADFARWLDEHDA